MTDDTSNQPHVQWMPTAGGVLSIIAGALGLLGILFWAAFGDVIAHHIVNFYFPNVRPAPWGIFFMMYSIISLFSIVFDILAIVGGIFALQRRNWGLSLSGAIAALLGGSWLLGALSTIFISLSRKEFN
jgi:hypothetical protein